MRKGSQALVLSQLMFLAFFLLSYTAHATKEENGVCKEINIEDIPVATSNGLWQMPEDSMRMTQTYNNLLVPGSDAYCVIGASTPTWDSTSCYGEPIYYRHTGNDFHRKGGANGIDKAKAITKCLVLLSQPDTSTNGWGESMVCAFRLNRFSSEIMTLHLHHLHKDHKGTSRKYSACDVVESGAEMALIGDTGLGPTHIHVNIRRWPNLQSLQSSIGTSGSKLLGKGYALADATYLPNGGFREPISFLYNEFRDYKTDENGNISPYKVQMWPYVRKMLVAGFDTGHFDGRFGEGEPLKRADAARWIKVAAMRPTITLLNPTYGDVKANDEAFPYVETLSRYPVGMETVLNPDASNVNGIRYFYPNEMISRAPALKMIALAFYADEYQKFYKTFFWTTMTIKVAPALAQALGIAENALFSDVPLNAWYAPYVYFGAVKGFVAFGGTSFRPADPIKREEMAKWVVLGWQNKMINVSHACAQKVCAENEYCDQQTAQCIRKAECVPTETQQCEVGGGYDTCSEPECSPGESQQTSCATASLQTRTCTQECVWSEWSTCVAVGSCTPGQTASCGNCGTMTCQSNYSYGPCLNEGVCSPGAMQNQICNGSGTQQKTCTSLCQWSDWSTCSIQPACTPGQTQQQACTTLQGYSGTQTRTCDQSGQWGAWSTCTSTCVCQSGKCCDGCNYKNSSTQCESWTEYRCEGTSPGQNAQYNSITQYCSGQSAICDGTKTQSGWLTLDDCTSSEVCVISGGISTCQANTCTDTYVLNSTSQCWDGNWNNVEICLNLRKKYSAPSNPYFEYQVCKDTAFQNSYKIILKDLKHSDNSPVDTRTVSGGTKCSDWFTIDLSYLTQYGTTYGAGLRSDIYSPSTCTDSSCLYRSAYATSVYKTCQ
jgi:hypothetical protein